MKIPVTNEQAIYFCGNVPSGGSGGAVVEENYVVEDGTLKSMTFEVSNNEVALNFPSNATVVKADFFDNSNHTASEINTLYANSIETIEDGRYGNGAFTNFASLEKVYLKNIRTIGAYAFSNNKSMKSMYFGKDLEEIKDNAFLDCFVTDIYYAGTEEEWNNVTIDSSNVRLANATKHFNYEF